MNAGKLWQRIQQPPEWLSGLAVTLAAALAAATLIAATLGTGFLNSNNWPTGGDTASHILYAKLYADDLLWSAQVTAWLPEVFAGLPFLSYYFPLPFMVIALLAKPLGFAAGFKWGAFLASMLLPGAAFGASRHWLRFSWPASCFAALAALAFLLHEQNSIWGGNLSSTLSGEFAYSYGVLFALLAMLAWCRASHLGRSWVLPALLEAASGFSHGFPLLVVGFSTLFLLLEAGRQKRVPVFVMLLKGHLLAFCLLGGWLWPMLEMHGLTIPNDASFPLTNWRDLLPATLWPVSTLGGVGLAALALAPVRRAWGGLQLQAVRYLASAAGLAAVAFIAGDQLGLADIRFFPLVWLLGGIVCAWLAGQALSAIPLPLIPGLLTAAIAVGMLGWFGAQVKAVPDWALWNHSGLDPKPQWQVLSRLFPAMRGDLWSPRLVFEHDPANNDLGSTRTLEALPLFLNHRPVLEGLYMESALLGPAVYQLQSEVSARPSSPLVRFPSGALDADFAARHMNALHSDTLLLRSAEAKAAIEASGLFLSLAAEPPFALYRLKHFDSALVGLVKQPLRWLPADDWMQDSFTWFKTRKRFDAYQPVYGEPVSAKEGASQAPGAIRVKDLARDRMAFETDAVGHPHLIKIAYHPRWRLESRGSLRIAAPGFMLVVPEEKEIVLVYSHTLIGKLGMAASSAALLLLGWIAFRGRRLARLSATAEAQPGTWRASLIGWLVLAAAGGYFAVRAPERVYTSAWESMRANRYQEAAADFSQAYALRRPPAKREEALFWQAKATELAGKQRDALALYKELVAGYHGYWVPESLHQIVVLERAHGLATNAALYIDRLREDHPGNRWTQKLNESEPR